MRTVAQHISARFNDDGQILKLNGEDIYRLCHLYSCDVDYCDEDSTTVFYFEDGSSIVITAAYWYIQDGSSYLQSPVTSDELIKAVTK